MANSWAPAELKNCKLENPSLLFGPLDQYLGRHKQRVLSPCITLVIHLSLLCTLHYGHRKRIDWLIIIITTYHTYWQDILQWGYSYPWRRGPLWWFQTAIRQNDSNHRTNSTKVKLNNDNSLKFYQILHL